LRYRVSAPLVKSIGKCLSKNLRSCCFFRSSYHRRLIQRGASAATIDDPIAFEAQASGTFTGSSSLAHLTSASSGAGKQLSIAFTYNADTQLSGVTALSNAVDSSITSTEVTALDTQRVQVTTGISLIWVPAIKKYVAGWSGFTVSDDGTTVNSVAFAAMSADGLTWSTPKAIFAARTDTTDDPTNVSAGGYFNLQLFDNGGKLGALVMARPDTTTTSLRAMQFASSTDGAKWSKITQINSSTTSPIAGLRPTVLASGNGVSLLWTSHNTTTDLWTLFISNSATKAATFGKPVALLTNLAQQPRFSVAANAKGEAILAFITTSDTDPNFYSQVLRRNAAGVWTTQAKAPIYGVADADVLNTAVAINSKGESLLTLLADDGSSYLNVYMQSFTAAFKPKDAQSQVAGSVVSGGFVFKVFYSDAGQVNLFYDKLTETPLDISEEYSFATTLAWSQGNLTDGLADPTALNDETTVIRDANVNVSQLNDFNLTYLAYNDTSVVVNSLYMQQSWAPVWGDTMPTVTSAKTVASKGGKITLTLPTDVKAAPAATLSFAWYVCTKKVAADQTSLPKTCTLNKKALKPVYVAVATEKGKFILATVTATNPLGSVSWISASTSALK